MDGPLKIKAILIDLSGTIHIDDEPTPNAIQALNKLVSLYSFANFIPKTAYRELIDRKKHLSTG